MRIRAIACIVLLLRSLAAAGGVDLYVAPNGNDANPGAKEKPFATLQRARDEIRRLKSAGPLPPGGCTVRLRGGVYRLEKALEFLPEDSGTAAAPITYAAADGEKPILSGGRAIGGWRPGSGSLWQTIVPGVKEGGWYFHQLFVDGQRRTRARTPNQGYLYTAGVLAPINRAKWSDPKIVAKQGFEFRDRDIRRWQNVQDALIVIYHSWTTSIHFITELDADAHTVRLAPPSTWPIGYWWEYNTRYHVENIIEALDEPGEWHLDRKTGVLSYWPLPGEDLTRVEVVAPAARQTLAVFKGDPAKKQYVEHLRFVGLAFQHADCEITPTMPTDQQGATERASLIAATGLRHTTFENCELAHAGENGLWLDAGCADNVIRRCHIHDLGGSGLFIGPKAYRDQPEFLVERNVVDNCFIHDGSHIFRGSQGVWIGRSSYNQLTHNEICDFHHLGVSAGHSWGYAPTTAHHNQIAWNHVHHICNGFFSDGGGIYTLGISPGTTIVGNIVHDVTPTPLMPAGGTGIYHDEGSTGILVENNIVYRVGAGPYHQHYGRDNTARNNIFAFGGREMITCARPEEHRSYTFEGNIVLSSSGQATSSHFSPLRCKTEFRRNLYWDVSGKAPLFSGVSFAEWQKTGRDADSKIADPQFYDAAAGDFRLKPTSPALAMGFKPIATDQVGLYGDPAWVGGPRKVKRLPLPELPPPPPAPPPKPFVEDFEFIAPGKAPETLTLSPKGRPDLIQVTEETAAGGKRCLKLTDATGLAHSWEPHVYYSSKRYGEGKVRFACDIQNSADRPAEVYLGLRDWGGGGQYHEGPSLTLKADGKLTASGRELAQLPLGRWSHVEIEFEQSASDAAAPAAKTYRLTVTATGEKPQVFEGLPYADARFRSLTWFGISLTGKPGTFLYVGNLCLEQVTK